MGWGFLRWLAQRQKEWRRYERNVYMLFRRYPTLIVEPGVTVKSPQRIELGPNVLIQTGSILHGGGMAWSGGRGHIRLGEGVEVSPHCILYGAGGIDIGDHTVLGPGAKILSQSEASTGSKLKGTDRLQFEPITIGKGCYIGAGAIILGGTELGDECIVGTGAVVKGKYPAHTTLIGNPARPLPRIPT